LLLLPLSLLLLLLLDFVTCFRLVCFLMFTCILFIYLFWF
jgi:hypothetical protein